MASPQSSTQSTEDLHQSQSADNAFNTANPMPSRVSHGTKDRSMSTPEKALKNSGSATATLNLLDQEKTALPVDSRHQLHHNGKGQATGLQSQPAPKHEPMYKKLNHLLQILENSFSSIHPTSGTQRGPTW